MTTQNTPEVTAAYDQVARTYADKYHDEILRKPKVQAFLADFVAAVPADGIIADVGCGPGQVARYVHHHLGRRTAGIDLSPEMVRLAAELNPTIPFRAADVLQLTETEVYDALIGLYLVVNFPVEALDNLFAKLHQLLKPGDNCCFPFTSATMPGGGWRTSWTATNRLIFTSSARRRSGRNCGKMVSR
jgi:trans-aconitate methyltransferase